MAPEADPSAPPPPPPKRRKANPEKNETLVNCRVVESKPIEGESLDWNKLEKLDWDAEMKKYREKLEKEANIRSERIRRQEKNADSWELYRLCKTFMEENERNWIAKKKERDAEVRRLERLSIGRRKKEELKEKVLERKLETEKQNLPQEVRRKLEEDENKKARLELK